MGKGKEREGKVGAGGGGGGGREGGGGRKEGRRREGMGGGRGMSYETSLGSRETEKTKII